MKWYLKCLKHYADFTGRARRMEYWMFSLFYGIICGWYTLMSLMSATMVGMFLG
jgi:uncharacterized membrane protein YhaH (DUF805 family)